VILDCGSRRLDLGQPCVMGVLNVTPDSFSDGGRYRTVAAAIAAAEAMIAAGATLIDIGGESTRPGATPVELDEELRRVLPVIEGLRPRAGGTVLSIDTRKPAVMRAALAAGVELVNDIEAFSHPEALAAVADSGAALCLMHMQGTPASMQLAPRYHDVVDDIRGFLASRIAACRRAGIAESRLAVDPGFGFGKTHAHHLTLIARLGELRKLGRPIVAGISRKSLVGELTGRPVAERLAGSVALAAIAVLHGASIVRAHDVASTVDAVRVAAAVRSAMAASIEEGPG
jgi:dihydropteroate synthase